MKKVQIHSGGEGEGGLDRGEGLRYDDGCDNKPLIPPPPLPLDNNPFPPLLLDDVDKV